jgi:hypothetical protein
LLALAEPRLRQHCKRHDDQLMTNFVRAKERRNSQLALVLSYGSVLGLVW